MTKLKLLAVASAMALSVSTATAADATVLIQGLGIWGAGTPTTAYSAAGAQFTFSFRVPDAFAAGAVSATTSAFTAYSYELNGVAVAGTPTSITFYRSADNGMFDLIYGATTVSLYGADIGSDGTVGPNGMYAVTAGINGAFPGTGSGMVAVSGATAVPEPASWAMMIAGMGVVGFAMRRRAKVSTSVKFA